MMAQAALPAPPCSVIVLLDMDAFYAHVEIANDPSLEGKPVAVCQYNNYRGGVIIAVDYEARKYGVKRQMRGEEALKLCPHLNIRQVPVSHGKADLTAYREKSKKVFAVAARFAKCIEKASIDEMYLDITREVQKRIAKLDYNGDVAGPVQGFHWLTDRERDALIGPTHIMGVEDDERTDWLMGSTNGQRAEAERWLAVGAALVAQLRRGIYDETRCPSSAGIATNKMLAKLAAGMHKPNQQTVLCPAAVPGLLATLPLESLRSLGGKLGQRVKADFNIQYAGELAGISRQALCRKYGDKTGAWLHLVARGEACEPVKDRLIPKSIGCSKTFPGPLALTTVAKVSQWLHELASELEERLHTDHADNGRLPTQLSIGVYCSNQSRSTSRTQAYPFTSHTTAEDMARAALAMFRRLLPQNMKEDLAPHLGAVEGLGMSASQFTDGTASTRSKSILERFVASGPTPRAGTGAGASDSEDEDSRSGLGDDTAVSMETAGTDGCHATGLMKWLGSSREPGPPDGDGDGDGATDDTISGGAVVCGRCAKDVPLVDMDEHLDWHVARDLHAELQRESREEARAANEARAAASNSNKRQAGNQSARGNKRAAKDSKDSKGQKSLLSYIISTRRDADL